MVRFLGYKSQTRFFVWEKSYFFQDKELINLALADPHEIFKQHLIKNEEQSSFWKRYSAHFGEVSTTVPCKKTRHEILQSDVLATLTTFQKEL